MDNVLMMIVYFRNTLWTLSDTLLALNNTLWTLSDTFFDSQCYIINTPWVFLDYSILSNFYFEKLYKKVIEIFVVEFNSFLVVIKE